MNMSMKDNPEQLVPQAEGLSMRGAVPASRVSAPQITALGSDEVFVFGSNLAGMHGGGAARLACQRFGAVWGRGVGLQGRSYAIPTMQGGVETIAPYVDEFIEFAKCHPHLKFLVTEIGCGIAGFAPAEIAPLFARARGVANIALPLRFWRILGADVASDAP